VTAVTIATWMQRADDDGPDALVRVPEPVNRFRDVVAHLVQRLKTLCPAMGKVRIAQVLARTRTGLHLSATTAKRLLERRLRSPAPQPPATGTADEAEATACTVTARYPEHVWNLDLSVVPTALGMWLPWVPFSIGQCWPFAWHLAVVVDHFSRAIVGTRVFRPIGRHGSIAGTERTILSIKDEGLRPTMIPFDLAAMCRAVALYAHWYNEHRPHRTHGGATPNEIYYGRARADDRASSRERGIQPGVRNCARDAGCCFGSR
jgi:transposase InsO family protein